MRKSIGFIFLAILFVVGMVPAFAEEPVDLRPHFKVGDECNTKTKIRLDLKVQSSQLNMNLTMQMGTGVGFKVMEVAPNGVYRIRRVLHSFFARMEGPYGISITYDSSNPLASYNQGFGSADELAIMIGMVTFYRVSPEGDVLEYQGVDEAIQKILKKMPEGPNKEKMEEQLKSQFADNGVYDYNAFFRFPKKPVVIGDTWQDTLSYSENGIPIVCKTNFKLIERKNGISVIQLNSEIKTKDKIGSSYKMKGIQSGTVEIDETTGWLIRSNISQKISGKVKTASGTVPVTMDTVETSELFSNDK